MVNKILSPQSELAELVKCGRKTHNPTLIVGEELKSFIKLKVASLGHIKGVLEFLEGEGPRWATFFSTQHT